MHDHVDFCKEIDKLRGRINPGMTTDEAAGINADFEALADRLRKLDSEEDFGERAKGMTVSEARKEEPPVGDVRVVEGGKDASEIGGAAKAADVSFDGVTDEHPPRRAATGKATGRRPRVIRSPEENDLAAELEELDPDNTLGE